MEGLAFPGGRSLEPALIASSGAAPWPAPLQGAAGAAHARAESPTLREMRGALAALHRQRCQLQREVQALAGEAAPAGGAAAPGAGVAAEALASPRRRCAPLPPGVAALRAAALCSMQGELLAACAALAADLVAPRPPASGGEPGGAAGAWSSPGGGRSAPWARRGLLGATGDARARSPLAALFSLGPPDAAAAAGCERGERGAGPRQGADLPVALAGLRERDAALAARVGALAARVEATAAEAGAGRALPPAPAVAAAPTAGGGAGAAAAGGAHASGLDAEDAAAGAGAAFRKRSAGGGPAPRTPVWAAGEGAGVPGEPPGAPRKARRPQRAWRAGGLAPRRLDFEPPVAAPHAGRWAAQQR